MTKEPSGFRKFFTSSGLSRELDTLPKLPTDIIKWIKHARPIVEGGIERDMRITPFWIQVYEDKGDLMVMNSSKHLLWHVITMKERIVLYSFWYYPSAFQNCIKIISNY